MAKKFILTERDELWVKVWGTKTKYRLYQRDENGELKPTSLFYNKERITIPDLEILNEVLK